MSRFKLIVLVVLTTILLVFVVQNATAYDVQFLVWKLPISGAALIFASAAVGFLGGVLVGGRISAGGKQIDHPNKPRDA